MSWLHDKTTDFLARINEAKAHNAFPFLRPFRNIGPRVKIGQTSYINFTSNDYLGLSQQRSLIRSAVKGTMHYGTGLGSSRLQASTDRHSRLEEKLAAWLGYPSCAVFATGYQSVVGVMSTYLDNACSVVLDNLSHASITDGAYLAKGLHPEMEIRFFKHNSVKGLKRVLTSTPKPKRFVVVEGLYGADGDIAPLADIVQVCREADAMLMVDDAHGIGALGHRGRGACELHGVLGEVDILMGSFSKSFGTVGGFILADRDIVDYLKVSAHAFIYSASLPLAQVEAALTALNIIQHDQSRRHRLERNTAFFRAGLERLGFSMGQSVTHITPVMIGDDEKAITFAAHLYHGAQVILLPFVYPGVPKGTARLRCNVTAAHSTADMGFTLEALSQIGKDLSVIPDTSETGASRRQRLVYLAESKARAARNLGKDLPRWGMAEAGKQLGALSQTLRQRLKAEVAEAGQAEKK